ncbi:hypothetical protein [Erwinia tracheiphila]
MTTIIITTITTGNGAG